MAAKSFGKLTRGMIQVIYTHIMEYVLKFMKRLVNSRIVSFSAIRVQGERYQASVSLSRQTKAAKSFIYVYRAGLWRYMSGSSPIARVQGGGDGLFGSKMAPAQGPLSNVVYWALYRIVRYTRLEISSIMHKLSFLTQKSVKLGCYRCLLITWWKRSSSSIFDSCVHQPTYHTYRPRERAKWNCVLMLQEYDGVLDPSVSIYWMRRGPWWEKTSHSSNWNCEKSTQPIPTFRVVLGCVWLTKHAAWRNYVDTSSRSHKPFKRESWGLTSKRGRVS